MKEMNENQMPLVSFTGQMLKPFSLLLANEDIKLIYFYDLYEFWD